ncbi:hypothetical protein [Methylomonas koyamae]|uniref:hypothetical protein n=1 Tax=Methylomonas koyamae TaxID=702114 RepID=UPI002FCC350F
MAGDKKSLFESDTKNRISLCNHNKTPRARYLPNGHKWQRRFWEHTILNDADYAVHMDYIHYNPVKHGWAIAVKNLPKGHKGQFKFSSLSQNGCLSIKLGGVGLGIVGSW